MVPTRLVEARVPLIGVLVFLVFSGFAGATPPEDAPASCAQLLDDPAITETVFTNLAQAALFPGHLAASLQHLMAELIAHFNTPNLDFAYFERWFRAKGIRIYLVANSTCLGPAYQTKYPPGLQTLKNGPALYYLWLGLNGKTEADNLKRQLGISEEENLERLKHTGFLVWNEPRGGPDPDLHLIDEATCDRIRNSSVIP